MWRYALYAPASVVLAVSLYFGVPYFKDNNETFQSYDQGWNLLHQPTAQFSFVTVNGVRGQLRPYTHNPNFPRYVHALLLAVGLQDITVQVALIAAVCYALSVWFITRLFEPRIAALIVGAMVLDWVGFQFMTNSYRAWSFVLFWGCLWAMRRNWTAFVAFFLLFQYEYGFAAFVAVTALLFADQWRPRAWALAGAATSLVVFAVQVVTYLGLKGTLGEFATTVDRRLAFVPWQWPTLFYSYTVLAVLAVALLFVRRTGLGRLYGAAIVGGLIAAIGVRGYVMDAFLLSGLPFLTFFVAVGFALVGQRLKYAAVVLAVPLLMNSWTNLKTFEPVPRGYVQAIRSAQGPVTSGGPIFGLSFAVDPRPGEATYELCMERPWMFMTCGAPYVIRPLH